MTFTAFKMRYFCLMRSLFLLFFYSCVSLAAIGQSSFYVEEERTFYGGLVAGVNLAQVDGDNYAGYNKPGMNFGGFVYMPLGSQFMAGLELSYVQKGAKGRPKESGIPGVVITDYNINMNYAEVPLMIYYRDNHWHHYGVGFSYARLVSYTESVTTATNTPHDFEEEKFPLRKNDFNFILGGNLNIWKGLCAGVRFQYSLIPVRVTPPIGLGRENQFNNLVAFRLAYVFGKNRQN
jgi:hypothetical protein